MKKLFNLIRKIILGIAIICLCLVGYMVITPVLLSIIGYYPDGFGPDVAQRIVVKGDSVKKCENIIFTLPHIFSPSAGEQRGMCIFEYAKSKKDPSACELLMPSSYGWSCLGGAMDHEPCGFFYEPNKEIRGQGKITTYDQCLSGPADIRNYSCCVMARISKNPDSKENCSSFQTDELKDQCHHEIAKRDKNVAECAEMKNPTNRTGCEVGVRALQKQ